MKLVPACMDVGHLPYELWVGRKDCANHTVYPSIANLLGDNREVQIWPLSQQLMCEVVECRCKHIGAWKCLLDSVKYVQGLQQVLDLIFAMQ